MHIRTAVRVLLTALGGLAAGLCAQELLVTNNGDLVRIAAPKFHFLSGKPLERIRNGRAVPYDFQLTIFSEPKGAALRRSLERFVFSYDLWEEKFQVKRIRGGDASQRLSAEAAEAWCLDQMSFSRSGLPANQSIWLRLEIRAQEPREELALSDDGGVSLTTLIEVFSRAQRAREQNYWKLESGPLRLSSLPRLDRRSGD